MASEEGQDYIAIPSGRTVLGYNPGQEKGMLGFYGGMPDDSSAKTAMGALRNSAKTDPNKAVIDSLHPGVIEWLVRSGIVERNKIDSISVGRVLKNAESRFQGYPESWVESHFNPSSN